MLDLFEKKLKMGIAPHEVAREYIEDARFWKGATNWTFDQAIEQRITIRTNEDQWDSFVTRVDRMPYDEQTKVYARLKHRDLIAYNRLRDAQRDRWSDRGGGLNYA